MSTNSQQERFQNQFGDYLYRGPDREGNTALHKAVSNGFDQVVEDLVAKGHDINAANSYGETPMLMAISPIRYPEGDERAIQQILLNASPDLTVQTNSGQGLLHIAAIANHDLMCEKMVRAGLDVNARDQAGATPLHAASEIGKADACKALLNCGADPSIENNQRKTARDIALGLSANVLDQHLVEKRLRERLNQVHIPDPKHAISSLNLTKRSQEFPSRARAL